MISLPCVPQEPCPFCGEAGTHDDECPVPEHEAMLAGDALAVVLHDPEDCPLCMWDKPIRCSCRCGHCCETLLIEATAFDARREPKIRERGRIIDRCADGSQLPPELADWILNGPNVACVFFHRDQDGRGVCEIHETRPLACRLFDCDHDERTRGYRNTSTSEQGSPQ